jgi:hypothetical protein
MDEAMDLRAARPDDFEPHIGSEFRADARGIILELAEVNRYGVQPNAPRTEPFSLIFTGEPGLAQGILPLRHATLGRIDIFVVPIGPGPDGRHRYESAFN